MRALKVVGFFLSIFGFCFFLCGSKLLVDLGYIYELVPFFSSLGIMFVGLISCLIGITALVWG